MGRRKQIVPKKSDNLEGDQQAAAEKNDEGKFRVYIFLPFYFDAQKLVLLMELLWDGNSEHAAQAWRKMGLFGEK